MMTRIILFTLLCSVLSAYSAQKEEPFFGGIWQSGSVPPSATTFPYFEQLFNQVTPEGAGKLKHAFLDRNNPDWASLDSMYAYANDRGWFIKQHTFVWKASTPPWFADMIKAAQWDSVRESTYDFMRQYFTRYPLTTAADIANETAKNVPVLGQTMYIKAVDTGQIHWWQAFQPGLYTNGQHLVWNTAMEATYRQWDWLIPIYRKARELTRELAPNCKLILNDHTLLRDALRRDLFISQVRKLKAEGLIDYMGEQGHHIGDLSSVQIQTELDILAKETGIPLVISEFDIRDNEVEVNGKVIAPGSDSLQLVYMKNVFPPIWEHPNTIGVTLWGYMKAIIGDERPIWLERTVPTDLP